MLPALIRRREIPSIWDAATDFDRLLNFSFGGASGLWSPAADVQEEDDRYLVDLELPGLTAEDIDINVENGLLTIAGERREEHEGESNGSSRYLVERRYGKFSRTFALPNSIDASKVTAKFENGVLTVTLPKAANAKARKIKIS